MDAWVVEVLREGYGILFSRRPPLSDQPLPMPSYSLSSIRGKALEQEFQGLLHKQAIEPAHQAPGFYSRLFVVQKDSGAWRPIIDLSTLNTYIASQRFHMETLQSVLRSIRPGDWIFRTHTSRFRSIRNRVGIFASPWEESPISSGCCASG